MTDKPENPPLFPQYITRDREGKVVEFLIGGATLRDLFAAAALQGILASGDRGWELAELSYKYAAAMLAERKKK